MSLNGQNIYGIDESDKQTIISVLIHSIPLDSSKKKFIKSMLLVVIQVFQCLVKLTEILYYKLFHGEHVYNPF